MLTKKQQLDRFLRHEIVSGSIIPGQMLPSQRRLVDEFSLARSSVREVVQQLELDGLISTAHGGRSICQNVMAQYIDMPVEGVGDNLAFQLQVMEARAFLEGEAAYFAALRATDQQLEGIAREFERMQVRSKGLTTLDKAKADLRFHTMIAESSHHVLITSFSQLFYNRYFNAIYGVLNRTLIKFGRYPDGIRLQHELIYQALYKRDAEQAKKMASEHVLYTRNLLESTD
ncbi:GntR family transcriptional regulator, transcriptional repressor for pyruvate dehydrogenase complex [Neptunomonas japonica JAMM 1380]|uniref:Pyruvate dehydrogenase complex repressor n=1 Tax=Neptunomonas japonica JAMM 1380 TaxID=1441457 RepID=A0A7R6PB87_9GAMM|nr:GntR family transcriptional regulator, transcriptional repressor for pyruvate dehydrogenase complex [Neptunomonas japonica JAMM 1380]